MDDGGGHKLVLVLSSVLVLIYVPMEEAVTTFGSPQYHHHHHQQQQLPRRKLASDNPGFISIDCGAPEDYYEESSGIFYTTDRGFIDTGSGKSGQISSGYKPWSSLTSFPTGIKNCYTLKPEHGKKNNKYLIRAVFVYGNYDGKNQPPTFDVYIGVNLWLTMMATTNSSDYNWEEAIHVPFTTDYINVCLVNTGTGTPFISTLELRPVNPSIYHFASSSELLHLTERYDVGSSVDIDNSYEDDVYDRYWQPLQLPDPENYKSWYPINISSTTDIQSSNNDTYKLPAEVLRDAAQTLNASTPLNYITTPPYAIYEYCIYFHFAEILEAKNGQLRKQYVSSNGVNLSTPVTLDYLKPMTIGPLSLPISGGKLQFSVHATDDSDLPPILNAFEIFKILKLPLSPTHPDDAEAMMDIKQKYRVTRNWQGDPCLPHFVSWDGLNCSNDSPPRIISMNLNSSGLSGNIATSISNLTSLQSLDLSYNMLTGPVPEFLAQLQFLKVLNLTGNKLTGSIPQALREKSNSGTLQLSLGENPDLCQLGPCKNNKNKKYVVAAVASLSVLVLVVVALAIWWSCKKKRQGDMSIGPRRSLMPKNKEFTYSEVVIITDNFRTVIGEGGFGKVYLGTLKNGDRVAVKMRSSSSKQGLKEFRNEALLLTRGHHGNLVSLIGFCDDGKNMVLVYEYMPNGDLRQHLSETNSNVLNWSERLQVARDAAQGLEYLHNGCKPPIIHRDVKTANILLNKDYQGKIADFGLSRDSVEADTHTTNPAGTFAYMDPEYISSRQLNRKSDVYSFGIVLLELITGQPALIRSPDMIHIVHWIRPFIERGDIRSIVDPRLQGEFNPISAWKAVEVAMSCIPPTAIQRPEMSDVLSELKECLAIEMGRHTSWSGKSNERSLSSSLELETMDLDTADITIPYAR